MNCGAAMDLYTKLVSHALFPLQERLKGHRTVAIRRLLERSQWWDRARLESLRLARLRALLQHAADHVPYYRRLFADRGFAPADVRSLDAIASLPLLSKADIRQNLEALKSDLARSLMRFNTGGSTGEPLIFYLGKERVSHDVAAKWRATRWWGVDVGDPEIVVWGSPIELGAQDRARALRDVVLRTRLLPAFGMSLENLDGFIERIRRRRPRMLFGYPSALSHIATHAERRGIAMNDCGIKVAFVTAEKLYDEQRMQIEKTFGCSVADGYGSREGGFIAHQCPAGAMHITAEDIVLEIVDESGRSLDPGRRGEIVVTHLATRDFPFIRYRTGDIGEYSEQKCACGRGLPILRTIEGRSTDFVVAQDGTVLHGLALIYVVRDIRGIRKFKIIQESVNKTRVLLATDEQFSESDTATISKGIGLRLGDGVRIEIERVAEIAPEASGKFRYIVSHVAPKPHTPQ